MNKLHLPCVQGCSLNDSLADSETLVRELIFTYKCEKKCSNCHLLNVSDSTMSVELAVNIVKESIDYAKENGLKNLFLHLIGGEVLDEFDCVKDFCNKVTELKSEIPIYFFVDTCGRKITDECKQWLNDNNKVYIRLRWNDFTKSEVWDSDNEFWSSKTDTVLWKIGKKNFSNIIYDVDTFADIKKYAIPEYPHLGTLDINDYKEYCRQLNYLSKYNVLDFIIASDYFDCCSVEKNSIKQIETVDVDGKKYFCKYMSPMYNFSRVYNKVYEQPDIPESCSKCDAKDVCELCPAARVLKNNYQCEILRRQYKAYCINEKS